MTWELFGFGIGILLALGVVGLVNTFAGELPAVEPSTAAVDYELSHEILFAPHPWLRGVGAPPAAAVPAYHRPLDVQVLPDEGILPPPREIIGVNDER
jgi:hypothetical protein